MRLADLSWPDVAERAASGAILAVPVGATEQHGPHLPLTTDTDIALALCDRLAGTRTDVIVAPAVAYGSSGEHARFAGTLSIGQEAIELLLLELGRSAAETFHRLLFVSAHGGNAGPVARAVTRLRAESRDVEVFQPRWSGEPHAGRPETALQLALRPEAVRMERAVPGDRRPIGELMPHLLGGGVWAVTATGVLGDPTGATAVEGAVLLDRLTDQLVSHVDGWGGR
ncbi:mycofactocin biosynthesis peptidyl-dipeptidase MftE [Amycolatopsis roodepoortensis]|uniref:mycofactocin biosynthesis peptidyl-dipeptidase MftE n=1 Tax=Amycolatopsis roodepoortensis TaxID=700274 RepID=UPI00214B24DF|nr:mycofactocin biosynthesis peptidyl-dipeptidase MftE [Amycolatopsis roodepoortensis]UUV28655.1 mycofactocin biosynthesis peptidyl-dipeptidase MftE [Amycolatopsis roodepoortensis]